jgi:hypothetical protein
VLHSQLVAIINKGQRRETNMKNYLLASVLVALAIGCGAPTPVEDDVWSPSALSEDVGELPEGREIVQRMIDFMRGHEELAVEARVTYESVQEFGQKLQFDMLQRIAMRKPDKLFWVTLRDDATQDRAWFDGGRFRVIRQPANMWGEIRLPGEIPEAIQVLVDQYMIVVPFPDILSVDPIDRELGDEITSIWYVGEAWVDGKWTDHVAIRKPGADTQIWVQQDEPFPAKMAIVYTEEEGLPGYTARFGKWSSALPADPELFEFTIPPDAERVEVVPVIDR